MRWPFLFAIMCAALSVVGFGQSNRTCTLENIPSDFDLTSDVDLDQGTVPGVGAAHDLIKNLIGSNDTKSAVIHVVRLKAAVGSETTKSTTFQYVVQSSHWYAVDSKEPWPKDNVAPSRLYGYPEAQVLLIFLNAAEGTFKPLYQVRSTGRTPANVQDLQDVAKVFEVVLGKSSPQNAALFDAMRTSKLNPKLRTSNLYCKFIADVDAPGTLYVKPTIIPVVAPAGDDQTPVPSPTAINIDEKEAAFDNEGFYHWDVSIGVPINSYKQLQAVTSSSGDLTANVDKRNLFAIADWYLWPVDLKDGPLMKRPYIVTGASIASKPLHGILAGVGWGPTVANVYGGFLIVTNNLPGRKTERAIKAGFGINLPVRTIMGKLGINTQTTAGK